MSESVVRLMSAVEACSIGANGADGVAVVSSA